MAKIHKIVVMMCCSLFLVGCSDAVENIEDLNQYSWQQYMSDTEFEQLKEGMTYMDVVEIARGGGEQKKGGKFIWRDEQLMTITYEITFDEDQLTKKEKVIIQGHSTRDLAEKEPAKPE